MSRRVEASDGLVYNKPETVEECLSWLEGLYKAGPAGKGLGCPWVGCRGNMYLDIPNREDDLDPLDVSTIDSCVILKAKLHGCHKLREIAELFGVPIDDVKYLQKKILDKYKRIYERSRRSSAS